ncbi:hypothetical protein FHS18_003064 [Paenibacillus phyllosphaerae]|uniref:VWFA domain-containing protein n=1 Tax=Paenibacillus phyllosphaerae TaxID=274593 RepID=A0A7W5FN63_9BACL|nr:vWA domain-containing protein [Paenibacillus phyllosphaerae]MBB3110996.1 hypothetical protein [Paenibacillus phyllosphaerae]
MPYTLQASQSAPALIIYLLDTSLSMTLEIGGRRKMDIVMHALQTALRQMVFRSTKGSRLSPRYRVAMLAYSDQVYDLLGGVKTIGEIAGMGGLPELTPHQFTDTAKAFEQAEKLLMNELPNMQHCPAPLVCHMTDGAHTGDDPEPFARRIMELAVADGHVLVENIFISEAVAEASSGDLRAWPGIKPDTPLSDPFAEKLKRMSSTIPESYREMMVESSFHIEEGALMLLPGTSKELISLGFQMSAATPVR